MLLISIYLITGPPLSPGQSNSYLTQFPFVKTEIVLVVIIQDVRGIQVILAHNVGLAYIFFIVVNILICSSLGLLLCGFVLHAAVLKVSV